MKDQILSIPLVKEQDIQCFIKQQESSSQRQKGRQRKDNLYFIGIEKTIFIELRQRKLEFIQQILSQLQTNQRRRKTNHSKNDLIDYLKKIKDLKFTLQTKNFNKTLIYFKEMFFSKIAIIWQNLSEQRKAKYEQIGIQNHKKMGGDQQQKVNINKYTGLQMLKIDALSVCFLFNKYYVTAFKDIKRKLLPYELLQKIFNLDKCLIEKMDKCFKYSQQDIRIDYRQELRHHIQLLYLMRVGCKICNYASCAGITIQSIPFVETSLDVDITDQVYSSKSPIFRFCQIAYEQMANLLKQKAQLQIVNEKMQQQMLQVAKHYCVSFEFLVKVCMKFGNSWNSHKEQLISCLQSCLYKCQWVFLKGKYSLGEGINTAFGGIFPCQPLFWSRKLGLISAATKIAMQRFNLLAAIFNMQIQLQSKLSIYVYKFQYSLRDYIGKQKLEEQAQDLKCTAVILVANQRIIAYSVSRNPLTHDLYVNMVKLCIRNKVAPYTKQFNLVIYDLDYEQTIDCDLLVQFQIYMNKIYDSKIYVVNDPSLFQPHFLIHAFFKCFLLELNIDPSNFHEYAQVCISRLLRGIDFFDKDTNEEYFAYFTKIMGLEFGIKDVWKCFKEDRGNRYNAVIFGGEESEEEDSKNIQQMIKAEIPQSQWFQSIRYCRPSVENFLKFLGQQKWRVLEFFQQSSINNLEGFFQRKRMKEKDIKRILRDVTNFLIDYQLRFHQLTKRSQGTEKSASYLKIQSSLSNFYEGQNKNIDQVYLRSQREMIIKQISKKFDKGAKVSDFCKINKFKPLKIKWEQQY